MRSLAASLVVTLSLALAACGGSTPAPDAPKADAPKADGEGAKKPDAKDGAGDGDGAKKADAPKTDDKKADAPKADDKKADATKKDERLEDQTMGKTTSAGGSYALKVLSVAGMPVDDVGKALSASSSKVDACYAKVFKSALGQNGKTAVDVVVNDKGKTGSVKLRSDETKNPELVKCLQDAVKAVEWPKPTEKAGGKTTIEWTLSGRLSGLGTHGANMGSMDGKVVVVTGAGGGIGRAEAMLFAKEGAKLVVNDVGGARDGTGAGGSAADDVVAAIRAAGGEAIANHASVTTEEGAESIVADAVKAFGRIDVLVNNAGILRDKTLLKMDLAMWEAVVTVHMTGTFLCTRAAARQMIAQGGGGRIVNTTSVSGMMGNFGQANYAAAKAGIYGFTRTAGIELQKHRITVNAIAPIAKTRMTEDLPMFQSTDTMTPEHVAPAALFLGSDLCGDKTGFVLAVAGARLYAYKVVESDGKLKDDNGVWTAKEIADNWDAIVKVGKA